MPVFDIDPGQNPQAFGTMTFGVEGSPAGFTGDSSGNLTLLGTLTADTVSAHAQDVVRTVATSGAAQTIPDTSVATVNVITLTANCTLTLPAAEAGMSITFVFVQDGTGSRTVTWPGSVKWASGVATPLSTAAAAVDMVTIICAVDGTWLAVLSGLSFS